MAEDNVCDLAVCEGGSDEKGAVVDERGRDGQSVVGASTRRRVRQAQSRAAYVGVRLSRGLTCRLRRGPESYIVLRRNVLAVQLLTS